MCPGEERKRGEEEAKRAEDGRNREKSRQRRHEDLLGEVCLPEERISNDDRSRCYAVNRPSEVAKPSGTPNSVMVHRPVAQARAL
jgi:hypothetical protein